MQKKSRMQQLKDSAHDLNNYLLVIEGNAQLAMRDLKAKDPGTKYLKRIIRAADQSFEAIKSLNTFPIEGSSNKKGG